MIATSSNLIWCSFLNELEDKGIILPKEKRMLIEKLNREGIHLKTPDLLMRKNLLDIVLGIQSKNTRNLDRSTMALQSLVYKRYKNNSPLIRSCLSIDAYAILQKRTIVAFIHALMANFAI